MSFASGILDNVLSALDATYSIVGWKDNKLWLEFDTIDECTTAGRASVTKYPTEEGRYGIDYKYSEPDTVTMTGVMSDGGILGLDSIMLRMGTLDKKNAIKKIRNNLNKLKTNMTLVNIKTRNAGLRTRLTLVDYEINETYDNYGMLEVSMTFQEIPLFNTKGQFVRNPSDSSTQNGGVAQTQQV